MKSLLFSFLMFSLLTNGQNYTIPLWENTIPNYKECDDVEESFTNKKGVYLIKNVQTPDISVFLPEKEIATGEAVVICPGGAYWVLAYHIEGIDIAKAFNEKGIAAIVLKYRLPNSNNSIIKHKSPLLDAQRAMKIVRYNADKWNINPNKVGVMGFSAGGHLASTLSTHLENGNSNPKDNIESLSSRPDFSILIYPVISFIKAYGHKGSAKALLGSNATQEMISLFSNEMRVSKNTPPTFLVHSQDDKGVSVKNSLVYYEALLKNNISAEMHLYPYGAHGFGLATNRGHLSSWFDRCVDWIHYTTNE